MELDVGGRACVDQARSRACSRCLIKLGPRGVGNASGSLLCWLRPPWAVSMALWERRVCEFWTVGFGKLEKRPETDGVLWWALIFTGTNLAVLLTCTSHLIPHCWQTSPLYTGSPWSLGFSVRFWPFQSSSCSDALKCPLIPAQKQLCRGLHIPGRFSSNTEVIAGCAITHYFPPCPHVAQCCGICPAWAENVEHATTGKNESAVRQSLARAEACSASLKSPIQRSESLLGPSGAGSNRL